MYVLLIYDIISDEKGPYVSRNIFKTCKKYLTNIQKSVFEGNLTISQYLELKLELKKYIRKNKDSVVVFKSRSEKWTEKEFLGKIDDKTSNFF